MDEKFHYRLSGNQKREIAQNLIDILEKDADITEQARRFICNWIRTGPDEKRKAFFDVWDIVLKDYLPTTRPVLFRVCSRFSKTDRIASFTGRLECARKFSKGKGSLLICDTKEALRFRNETNKAGEYRHTFYPLVSVLIKARDSGGWGFSERFLTEFIGEDEYIMRINSGDTYRFKWASNDH